MTKRLTGLDRISLDFMIAGTRKNVQACAGLQIALREALRVRKRRRMTIPIPNLPSAPPNPKES